MSEQRHIVKRQVIELTIRGSAEPQAFQHELSRVYRQRIIPLIERRCNEFSAPDRLYRIETLGLDLGMLDPYSLEEDFVAKVDAALQHELATQIQAQETAAGEPGSSPQVQSQLELFAFFARTGSLPWWADSSRSQLLAENVEQLLRESPKALGRLLPELARQPQPRRRMINHYTDAQLAELCGLFVPAYQAAINRDFRALLDGLQSVQATTGGTTPARLRQVLWNNALLVASMGGQQHTTLEAFYQAILKRVLTELGSTGSALFTGIHRAIKAGRLTVDKQLTTVIAGMAEKDIKTPANVSQALTARLAELQALGGPLSAVWAKLRRLLRQLPTPLQAALLAALNSFPAGTSTQAIARAILQVLPPDPQDNAPTETAGQSEAILQNSAIPENNTSKKSVGKRNTEMSRVIHVLRELAGDLSAPHGQTDLKAPASAQEQILPAQAWQTVTSDKKALDLSFSEADELQVGNAGLVILWPFLGHFFTRLGLMDQDRRFTDVAARQRAAGLLQVLAMQDAAPPEYLLPLNKLLCGLDVTELFEFGPPLRESEAQECTDLLEAVITQAPILHNMSADGFRGSFLLRPGLLSMRDGMWLLRVERQTFDVVLDNFPWSWEWVKLSWMEAPLRVEW